MDTELINHLYVDDEVIAINKPAGILTIPDGYDPTIPHLRSFLEPTLGRLWIVHRLDKDTSGVVLLARNKNAHRILSLQFENRTVRKQYHAIIIGQPPWQELEIDLPLRINGDRHHRTVPAPLTGKPALTKIRILERLGDYCLVEAEPLTGYTHQIRAHLAAVGFPILSDALYGKKTALSYLPVQQIALHARAIHFLHPTTGLLLEITAPYPSGFADALSLLRERSF